MLCTPVPPGQSSCHAFRTTRVLYHDLPHTQSPEDDRKVGIIGAGNVGSAFARRVSAAGHDVLIASRDMQEAEQVAKSTGAKVRAVPQEQLGGATDVLIAATPYSQQAEALQESGNLDGQVVIDISNPMTEEMSLAVGLTTSAAEEVASTIPGAKVVKAFNTVFAQVLGQLPDKNGARVQVFYAGDDESANSSVRSLVESMGFEAVDAGPVRNARLLEPMGALNIYLGHVAGRGTDIAFATRRVTESEPYADRAAQQPKPRPHAGGDEATQTARP